MIRVCNVRAEGEVTSMQGLPDLGGGRVRDAPVRVKLVAKACIRDETIEWGRALGDRTAGL